MIIISIKSIFFSFFDKNILFLKNCVILSDFPYIFVDIYKLGEKMKKEKIFGIGASVLILILAISPAIAGINTKVDESILDYYKEDSTYTYKKDIDNIADYYTLGYDPFFYFGCHVDIECKNGIVWPDPGPRFPGGYLRFDIVAIGEWTLHIDPIVGTDFYANGETLEDKLIISMWIVTDADINSDPGYEPDYFNFSANCKLAFGVTDI